MRIRHIDIEIGRVQTITKNGSSNPLIYYPLKYFIIAMFTSWSFSNIAMETLYASILFIWVVIVVNIISKKSYEWIKRKRGEKSAVYFARKVIHFLAGGLVAVLVPYLFKSPVIPFTLATILTIIVYIPHRTGKLMYWFQVEDNIAEVYFTIMWGVLVIVGWIFDAWLGIIPILFMAWGDGITGIVRNIKYSHRTKAWEGNIAMLILCIPIGYIVYQWFGVLAAIVSSIVEHYEFIDDNISVPLVSFIILLIGLYL